MKALVYKSTGSWYSVKTDTNKFYNARIKGIFKIDGITSTNPIAVGDEVEVELEDEAENTVIITNIYNRKNYVTRQSPHHKKQHHIIAANINQSILFATLKDPKTSTGFIDRFLVVCEMYHIPAIIIFNKADLYNAKDLIRYEAIKEMYERAGYIVILASVLQNTGVEKIKQALGGKTSLLSGHSGVGKSTFINKIFPELNLKILEVSAWSGKGMHSTTFAEMFDLPFEGKIIDTPGIRELGLVNVNKQDLSHYFPEMRILINDCQFNNCKHINEPGCAVKDALQRGVIAEERYLSYAKLLDSIDENSWV